MKSGRTYACITCPASQEVEIRKDGIPIPSGFTGGSKSWTLQGCKYTDREGVGSIGVMCSGLQLTVLQLQLHAQQNSIYMLPYYTKVDHQQPLRQQCQAALALQAQQAGRCFPLPREA